MCFPSSLEWSRTLALGPSEGLLVMLGKRGSVLLGVRQSLFPCSSRWTQDHSVLDWDSNQRSWVPETDVLAVVLLR
jgi:hypothetical protein